MAKVTVGHRCSGGTAPVWPQEFGNDSTISGSRSTAPVGQSELPPSIRRRSPALDDLHSDEAHGWIDLEDDAVVADAPTIRGPRELEHVSGVGVSSHRFERRPEAVGLPRRKPSEAFCRCFGNEDAPHTPWLLRAYSTCRADNPHRLARWHACRLASAARRPAGSRGVQGAKRISPSLRTRPLASFRSVKNADRGSQAGVPGGTLQRRDPLIFYQLPLRN